MPNQTNLKLDNELAQATDALLGGRDMGAYSPENAELVGVVRDLAAVIDPRTPPSAAFQQRLTQRLNAEWDRAYPQQPTLSLLERPVARLASLAATVVLVLGALLILAAPEASPELQGAAIPVDDALAFLMLIGAAAVGFAYWRIRH